MSKIPIFLANKQVYGTILVLIATWLIYKLLKSLINKIVIKGNDDLIIKRKKTIIQILKNVLKYFLLILMVLILLNLYGVNTSSLIAGLGIAGAVIGFALQDSVKDIANGATIIMDNYFVVGDIVDFNGFVGTVIEFGLKTTKIKKVTGEVMIIANRNIDKIINISKEKATVIINIPTAYEENYEKVEKILKATVESTKIMHEEITEFEYLGIDSLDESSITYSIKITCLRGTQWNIKRELLKNIKKAYDDNNIKIPYRQLEVHNGTKL